MKKKLFLIISLFVFATNFVIGCAGSKTYIDKDGLPIRVEVEDIYWGSLKGTLTMETKPRIGILRETEDSLFVGGIGNARTFDVIIGGNKRKAKTIDLAAYRALEDAKTRIVNLGLNINISNKAMHTNIYEIREWLILKKFYVNIVLSGKKIQNTRK